jgi:small conductance mechanosensitive channel
MENSMSLLELFVIPWAIRIVTALAVLLIGKWLSGRAVRLLIHLMECARLEVMLVKFLSNLAHALLLVAVVLAAVDSLGVDITSFLAIVGAAGLAVGLALKDSLSNFAAGVMIIIFRPFRIGDVITTAGCAGQVDEIGMFCTLLRTGDNQRVIVPNSAIINGTIINANALGTRRIDLVIGISYDDNIGKAKDIIESVVRADGRVLGEPACAVEVANLADSSVNLNVRPWVKAGDYWAVRADLLENLKTTLEDAGITIPYPQQEMHVYTVDKTKGAAAQTQA